MFFTKQLQRDLIKGIYEHQCLKQKKTKKKKKHFSCPLHSLAPFALCFIMYISILVLFFISNNKQTLTGYHFPGYWTLVNHDVFIIPVSVGSIVFFLLYCELCLYIKFEVFFYHLAKYAQSMTPHSNKHDNCLSPVFTHLMKGISNLSQKNKGLWLLLLSKQISYLLSYFTHFCLTCCYVFTVQSCPLLASTG